MRRLRAVACSILGLACVATGPAAAVAKVDNCGVCHPESRVQFAASVHLREGISCTSCHGGDAASREVETAHRGDFRSLADRGAIPALCAVCHSDLEAMRPYNLPVDQLAVYQTSHHGRAVARGDTRAAVCSDCHGSHDLRPAREPGSRVHPRNLAETCGECHGDEGLMTGYGLDASVVEKFLSGHHGRALLVEGNPAAPSCAGCHGTHGPAPPGFGDLQKVCGACHVQVRRAFLQGPHAAGMKEAGLQECVSCHSSHATEQRRLAGLEGICADCHGDDSEASLLAGKLRVSVEQAAAEIERAEELIVQGEQAALEVEDHLGRLEEARTYLTEVGAVVHAVSLPAVEQLTRRSRSIGLEIQHEIYAKLDQRPKRLGLIVFWFYILMTLAILHTYKRRLRAGRETP